MTLYCLVITYSSERSTWECRSYHEVELSEKRTYREAMCPTSKEQQVLRALNDPITHVKGALREALAVYRIARNTHKDGKNYCFYERYIPEIFQKNQTLPVETKRFILANRVPSWLKNTIDIFHCVEHDAVIELIEGSVDNARVKVEEVRLDTFQSVHNVTGHWE